jgi:hypothetical protein
VNSNRIIDISIPIRPGLAAWPGDVPYELSIESPVEGNPNLTLGAV